MVTIFVFVFILTATMLASKAVFLFLLLNLGVGIFLSISQIIIALLPRFEPKSKKLSIKPFISVLVPANNEPPEILMQTLEALLNLNYKNFEVLIIDNNTKDLKVWKPVQNFAKFLGNKFRFFHIEHLSGFKAGALNFALERLNPKSEYVAIIDADYVVKSDFLDSAMSYFIDEKLGLVQFPQHYRNITADNSPIADEYRHFFGIYMNMANHFDCVPSTGTVSVYKVKVLKKIGGFKTQALTEDADVGLRIYEAGFRGVYVDRAVGLGLMPYDLEAYRKQKWRWAYGNAQSIKTLFFLFGKIPFKSWFGFLVHLTAWDHLHFLPFAVLAAYSFLLTPVISIDPIHRQLLTLASFSIFVTIGAKFFLFLVTLRQVKNPFPRSVKAFIVHMGMTLVYSRAWLACLFGDTLKFERTNKFVFKKMPSLLKNSFPELILGGWFFIGAIEAVLWGTRKITILAFFISSFCLLSIYFVYWKITPTKIYTQKLILDLKNKYKNFLNLTN